MNRNKLNLGEAFETLKTKNMKVTIKRAKLINGDHFFRVYDSTNTCLMSFYFNPTVTDPNSTMNEQYALSQAEKQAKVLESGELDKDIEEIIYQTPDDLPSETFQAPGTTE